MKIAIISGASSGIGKAISKELDSMGLDELWLISRSDDQLKMLQAELTTKSKCIPLDLTITDSFDYITSLLIENKCEIKYLVASAGVGYTGILEHNSANEISRTIDLNCRALTLLINITLPFMKNGGKILTVASGAGFLPQPEFAVYAATKAYVISLSKAIRKELQSKGIGVTALCPGPVDTNFFSSLKNVKAYKKKYLISPEKVAKKSIIALRKNKALCTPTISMKAIHLCAKIFPSSLLLKFTK